MRVIAAFALAALLAAGVDAIALPMSPAMLEGRDSPSGRCGADNGGFSCTATAGKQCCSQYGWCGDTAAYCGGGCQTAYGICTTTTPPTTPPGLPTTTNQRCGAAFGFKCGATVDKCCSVNNWCGDTTAHCGTGCQAGYGTCTGGGGTPPVSSTTAAPPGPTGLPTSPTLRCGAAFGFACPATANKCCSVNNWCGDTADHCGTGCQGAYGACGSGGGTTPTPPGNPTMPGSVPYGSIIYSCTTPGTVALTYDDGPYLYTSALLDILASNNVKATFFVVGNNLGKGAIDNPAYPWAAIIQRAYNSGHQIGSHTWDHLDLSTLTETDRRFQMTRLETALRTIIGRTPTYMRPPYISCTAACQATLLALGYHTIFWDLDTDDYNNDSPSLIVNSQNNVLRAISGANLGQSFMSIAHDIHYQTVYTLTQYQIDVTRAKGFRFVTLGECMGDPVANWYRA
ncbi:hypothetical protein DFH27DRAFT_192877 [Peziza echinospora]|nr:hypothetical protein DFH27DRAFT_192877 [Peziza echinospora]